MDKDVPLYHRLSKITKILGLENESKLCAKILITLNERLGQYSN